MQKLAQYLNAVLSLIKNILTAVGSIGSEGGARIDKIEEAIWQFGMDVSD